MNQPFQFSMRRMFLAFALCCVLTWCVATFLDYNSTTQRIVFASFIDAAASVVLLAVVVFPAAAGSASKRRIEALRLVLYFGFGMTIGAVLGPADGVARRGFMIAPAHLGLAIAAVQNYFEGRQQTQLEAADSGFEIHSTAKRKHTVNKLLRSATFAALFLCVPIGSLHPAEPASSCDDIFKSAVAVWQFADLSDSAGKNELKAVGKVTVGQKLDGEARDESRTHGGDGQVANLDGGYLDAGQGAGGALNITGSALTLCARLRNPSGQWGSPIFSKHGGHDRLVYNLYSLPGEIGFELGTKGAAGVSRTTVPVAQISPSEWHTVVERYDGSRLQMFVDGVLLDEVFPSGALREGNALPCLIGAESYGDAIKTGFKGQIDHVAIWKRALADPEIERLSGGRESIAAARKRYLEAPPPADLYHEKLRPQFHFTARQWSRAKPNPGPREEGWLNDPNGLVYLNGEYHLFAQRWNKCWIHAVSKDLVHWTELAPAFWEDGRFGSGVQSGGAVVDRDNTSKLSPDGKATPLVAFWAGNDNRSQCISYSLDGGRTWQKHVGNPVLVHPERDPKVFWFEPEKHWIMVLSGNGSYHFFTSPNLLDWHNERYSISDSYECPDMFRLPVDGDAKRQKWVLIRGNGKYSIGEFDGHKFAAETEQLPCDLGPNFYATQSWGEITGQPGRQVQIAWMNGGRYPDMPFNQQMTFPCDLTLRTFREGIRLCRLPVPEIKSLYEKTHAWKDVTIRPGENLLKDLPGELFDIRMQVDLAGAKKFGLKCHGEPLTYNVGTATLSCRDKQARLDPSAGRLSLRALADRTSIEIFSGDGKLSMSCCYLPGAASPALELFSDGNLHIVSLDIAELQSAWPSFSRAQAPPGQRTIGEALPRRSATDVRW